MNNSWLWEGALNGIIAPIEKTISPTGYGNRLERAKKSQNFFQYDLPDGDVTRRATEDFATVWRLTMDDACEVRDLIIAERRRLENETADNDSRRRK